MPHVTRFGPATLCGSTHLEKAVEMRNRYRNILNDPGGLSPADQAVARERFEEYRNFVDEHRLDDMMSARSRR